jgi:ribonuclease Y
MSWFLYLLALGVVSGGAWAFAVYDSRRRVRERLEDARADAAAVRKAAEMGAASLRRAAETQASEEGLELLAAADRAVTEKSEELARREERVSARDARAEDEGTELAGKQDALSVREREVDAKHNAAKDVRRTAEALLGDYLSALEKQAGATAHDVRAQLADGWIEEVRAEAAQRLRTLDQNTQDPEYGRQAKRIMGIAIQRYQGHYLTERLLSNIALPSGMAEKLSENDGLFLHAIEEGAGVKLELAETGEKVRLDSGDGVAREVARRALHRLIKGTAPRGIEREPKKWVEQLGVNLDREILDLGKRAFAELEIQRSHPDIVKLVGCLNYRTSYTQNQWKHALEAAFLGGMMASELGLDVKLARRATLMHDIGKALTHEIDGSHAVIGADYARRLGEVEVVANAIGAHHADEPPNSVYAFLVAAADAMSGARPGARREQTESYSTRLDDLERISAQFRGVDRAFAVQGGREVRIYVRENEVSDLDAVQLSGEIARKISGEMTFPGQIKVTVIRSVEAVDIAN